MDARTWIFPDEAAQRLAYLPGYGFAGPIVEHSGATYPYFVSVKYRNRGDTVETRLVFEYMNEEYVATILHFPIGPHGMQHKQLAATGAGTEQEMCLALDAQCEAVHELLRTQNSIART